METLEGPATAGPSSGSPPPCAPEPWREGACSGTPTPSCSAGPGGKRPPDRTVVQAPPPKRARPGWGGVPCVRQRIALACTVPFTLAVLTARACEGPNPLPALEVLYLMKQALLNTDDAPGEDAKDGRGTACWNQATGSLTGALRAAWRSARSALSDPGVSWPPPLDSVPDTPGFEDERIREWWRRRVRRYLPEAAWARLIW